MRCQGLAGHPELIVAGVTHLLINAEHMLFPNFMLFHQVWTGGPLLGKVKLAIAATDRLNGKTVQSKMIFEAYGSFLSCI